MPKLVSKRTVIPAGAQSSAASPLQQSRQDRHRGVLSFKTKDGNFGFIAADNKQKICRIWARARRGGCGH